MTSGDERFDVWSTPDDTESSGRSILTNGDELPPAAEKKAANIVRDGRVAPMVVFVPVLSLFFILRLVQWYLLKNQYPLLVQGEGSQHEYLAKDFRAALPRLWRAVLYLPCAVLLMSIYVVFVLM